MLPKELGHLEKDEKRNKEINQTNSYLAPSTEGSFFYVWDLYLAYNFETQELMYTVKERTPRSCVSLFQLKS